MTLQLDETHDVRVGSWVPSAARTSTDFPLQNLPFGVFRRPEGGAPRIGIAIGDRILDLRRSVEVGALPVDPGLMDPLGAASLNSLLSRGRSGLRAVRGAVFALLREDSRLPRPPAECLVPASEADLLLPAEVGDYTDFYASVHHATNVGTMLRPDQPLLPNYKWIPIGYHGRASSLLPGGSAVRRPRGQLMREGAAAPVYAPTDALDYECEVGFVVGRPNPLGDPVPVAQAEDHLAGLCLVNDWSARDVQRWEYQPLGPFLSKSFATTVSPWLVTLDALEPFRVASAARPGSDPRPLPYLEEGAAADRAGFQIELEVLLRTGLMRSRGEAPFRVSRCSFAHMYWSAAQLVAHHTSNGCNLRPGDLLASGTVSGPEPDSRGCLLELTWRGRDPLALPSGETRRFLEDGDEVVIRGSCAREGFARVGFGECRGMVLPAEGDPG